MNKHIDPSDIERDLDDRRRALAETLGAIAGQVDLENLAGLALQGAETYGRDAMIAVRRAARDNPAAVATAGAGLALLAYGAYRAFRRTEAQTLADRVEDGLEELGDDISEAYDELQDSTPLRKLRRGMRRGHGAPRLAEETLDAMGSAAEGLGDDLADLTDTAGEYLDEIGDELSDGAEDLSDRLEDDAATLGRRGRDDGDAARARMARAQVQARRAGRKIGAEAAHVAHEVEDTVRAHPGMSALAAFAAGAAAVALIPKRKPSRKGKYQALRDQAADIFEDEKQRAIEAIRAAARDGQGAAKTTFRKKMSQARDQRDPVAAALNEVIRNRAGKSHPRTRAGR